MSERVVLDSSRSQHDPAALVRALGHEGLIQFGRFTRADGAVWPVAVRLLWLPSYPALLEQTAAAIVPLLGPVTAERMLTTREAIPLGVAVSLRSGLPMTYPYGDVRDYTAAYAIEGAYDVGHPTVLLSDMLVDAAHAEQITALARRVGLDVATVLTVIDLGLGARQALEARGYRVEAVVTLRDALPVLEAEGLLPQRMRATVEAWIAQSAAS